MIANSALGIVALAVFITGCAWHGDAASDVSGSEARSTAWVEVAVTQFESDGETGDVTLPARAPCAAVALRAISSPGVCFQLSAAVDGAGHAVISGRSAGVFCRDCELRTSVVAQAGVFVLPVQAGRFEPETGAILRFAQVDCLTLTPLAAPSNLPTLRIETQTIEMVPDRATIDLRFYIADSSILFGDENRQQALLTQLAQEFAASGIQPQLIETQDLIARPADLHFHAGDTTALADLRTTSPSKTETTLDVVFGGCLLYDDGLFGPPQAIDGFTPRIPGGAGAADAVFMPGLDCFAESAGPIDIPVRTQAHILAHEIGHYLGLYHAVEEDGFTDQLDDTTPDNIMHFNPQRATAIGFSPSQGRILRMHPAARAR